MTMRTILSLSVCGFGLGLGAAIGCVTVTPTDHCMNGDGDAWCAERYPDGSRPFCGWDLCFEDVEDGCVAEQPVPECHSACGDRTKLSEDPECDAVAEGSSSSDDVSMSATAPTSATEPTGDPTGSSTMTAGETESSSSTTGAGCLESSECVDVSLPICEGGVCVACDAAAMPDGACEQKDAELPVCGAAGACVQCSSENASACGDETPVCDGASSACVGCTYHEQCEESACRIATGACFDPVEVYDVGQGQTYTMIGDAVSDLGEGVQVVLRLHPGPSFDEGVILSGTDTAYAFVSAEDAAPQWIRSSGMGATLAVEGDAEAYVQNVRFSLNGFSGAAAIEADGASVWLDRTAVVANQGGGLALTGSAFAQVRNCFVGGGTAGDVAALFVDGGTLESSYTTIVGNDDGFDGGAALRCTAAAEVSVRNSLLVKTGSGAEIECGGADVSYSATEGNTPGTGNVPLGNIMPSWLVNTTSDFHLNAPPAEVLTTAQWQSADPPTDIDGTEPRPNVDGTADVAGADIP